MLCLWCRVGAYASCCTPAGYERWLHVLCMTSERCSGSGSMHVLRVLSGQQAARQQRVRLCAVLMFAHSPYSSAQGCAPVTGLCASALGGQVVSSKSGTAASCFNAEQWCVFAVPWCSDCIGMRYTCADNFRMRNPRQTCGCKRMRPPAVQLRLQPDCGLITWPKSESLHTLFHRSPVCFGCCCFSWQTRAQWLTEKTPFAYQLLHCRSAWHPGCHCDFSAAVSLTRRINGEL